MKPIGRIYMILMLFFIFLICEMGLIEKFSILVTSSYDNQQYKVQEHPNSVEAANLLAKINQNIDILIKHLKDNYPDHEGVRRLIRRLNLDNFEEGPQENDTTSYTINKGELVSLCLREKNKNKDIHPLNTMMFVVIHELAHIMSITEGHNDEFMENFRFLLKEADACYVYQPRNYKNDPLYYCGMTVTHNPYYNSK